MTRERTIRLYKAVVALGREEDKKRGEKGYKRFLDNLITEAISSSPMASYETAWDVLCFQAQILLDTPRNIVSQETWDNGGFLSGSIVHDRTVSRQFINQF